MGLHSRKNKTANRLGLLAASGEPWRPFARPAQGQGALQTLDAKSARGEPRFSVRALRRPLQAARGQK